MTLVAIAGTLFAAVSTLGAVLTWSEAVYARASKHWPRTLGSIVTSRVSVEHDGAGRVYDADIRYRYVVDGHEYTCDRVRFAGRSFTWRKAADTFTKRYPAGAAVTVAYDPAEPSRGVLEPGQAGQAYLKVLLFAVCVVAGVALMLA